MFVALCDDDPAEVSRFSAEVTRLCKAEAVPLRLETHQSGPQLLDALRQSGEAPDIVLLDVGMPGMDGLAVAAALRDEGFGGVLVFISRSTDRVLDAFDVDAFNYVVKQSDGQTQRFARVFLESMQLVRRKRRRYLLCKGISENRNIPLDTIRYFSMQHHLCTAHYGNGEAFEFVTTLGRLENMLAASGFVRIQRSFMVNCAHVADYTFRACTLDDGTQLTVSRNHAATLRNAMQALQRVG